MDSVVEQLQVPVRTLYGMPGKNPSEVAESKGFVCGIMGLPYTGKTSLLPTLLPKYGPIAMIDMAGGSYVLPDMRPIVQVFDPPDWNTLNNQIHELAQDPEPFKSIWIDAVSWMQYENQDYYDIHSKNPNDKRGRQVLYGESNWDVVRKIHSQLIDLANTRGINVFFVYWITRPTRQEGGETILEQRHIQLSPTVGVAVNGVLDILIATAKQTGSTPYPPMITLDGDQSIETKVRLNPNNPLKRWSGTVQANPTILSDMIDAFKGIEDERYIGKK